MKTSTVSAIFTIFALSVFANPQDAADESAPTSSYSSKSSAAAPTTAYTNLKSDLKNFLSEGGITAGSEATPTGSDYKTKTKSEGHVKPKDESVKNAGPSFKITLSNLIGSVVLGVSALALGSMI
ncbi:hypothetical protein BB559_000827 [Furculomyces boomerangus]|uniref:Uncharacterized protein n=2 Tax=Harpellales TaxID=61421 RepID=A0A2T9Z3Y9_9FUNG|nr:hypothetical protein BB559_000827 [Furculomyces boomerangus]PWA03405.1 hypothetical protein BB558_000438 [Smittium angustum]